MTPISNGKVRRRVLEGGDVLIIKHKPTREQPIANTSQRVHICTPVDGMGECGRLQPYHLVGRTDGAILRYRARQEMKAVV